MARAGKLTKLKSVFKKLNSFNSSSSSNKQIRPSGSSVAAVIADHESSSSYSIGDQLRPVYVGKSRRRYLISSDIIDHPLFRELAERSSESSDDHTSISIACEVVLFEHLLWMLENADTQAELDELVEFYAC